MKLVWYLLVLFLFIPVQSILVALLGFSSVQPDLGLILLYFIGLVYGETHGIFFGLSVGFFMDLFSGGPLGTHLVSKTLLGWACGMFGKRLLQVDAFFTLGAVFCLAVLNGLISFLVLSLIQGGWEFWASVRWVILPEAVYDALLATVLFLLISKPIETVRLRSEGFSRL